MNCNARFIGADGSMGLTHGRTYQLIVQQKPIGKGLSVAVIFDDTSRTSIPYSNILTFFRNWEVDQLSIH